MNVLLLISFLFGIAVKFSSGKHDQVRKIVNNYLMYIGLPLLIFLAFLNSVDIDYGKIILIGTVFNLIALVLFYFVISIMNIDVKRKASMYLCTTFGNYGFVGIPFGIIFFGDIGGSVAAIMSIITALLHFTIGVVLANSFLKKKEYSIKSLLNPISLGILLAFILSRFNMQVPELIGQISSLSTYLLLFVIGMSIEFKHPGRGYISSFIIKFIAAPTIMIILVFLLGVSKYSDYYPLILLSFMPGAMSNTVLASKYKFDDTFASNLVSVSTFIVVAVMLVISFFR
ncbi:AEC family transporter [Candidatus Woesearchaeota archaeon]|nr:AEC family transporter [Candidatus Woesearchaeota archaeon]